MAKKTRLKPAMAYTARSCPMSAAPGPRSRQPKRAKAGNVACDLRLRVGRADERAQRADMLHHQTKDHGHDAVRGKERRHQSREGQDIEKEAIPYHGYRR